MMDISSDTNPTQNTLDSYFNLDDIQDGKSLNYLLSSGGIQSLCKTLSTSKSKGIDSQSILKRQQEFGKNEGFKPTRDSIFDIIWDSLQDTVIQILICASFISLIIGTLQDPESGWIEGVAILIAVIIVVTVTTSNDYVKDGKFIKLSNSVNLHQVVVTRDAREQEIPSSDLVVGDLLHISPGEVLEIDGILVKSYKIQVDQSSITGESVYTHKSSLDESGKLSKISQGAEPSLAASSQPPASAADPFLLSGSKVVEGSGQLIVCCVGLSSFNEKIRAKSGAKAEDEATPLQEKLEEMAWTLGKIGLVAGIFMAAVLMVYIGIEALDEGEWTHEDTSDLVSALIIGITILVIAIPEGLPLAVTLSMAYSVIRMKEEKIFVRHIRGCEVMGAATNILTDKTGTLTENKMKITDSFIFDCKHDLQSAEKWSEGEKEVVGKVISRNSTAFYKLNHGVLQSSGSKTEAAMIDFVKLLGKDVYNYRDPELELARFAFTSGAKKMTTVYQAPEGKVEVYSKGAGEVILSLCSHYLDQNQEKCELNEEKRNEVHLLIQELCSKELRVLGLAIKSMDFKDEDWSQEHFESGMTFIGLVAMKDSLRKDAKKAVRQVQQTGVTVRMVTGDNLETAVSIARLTGILEELEDPENEKLAVMLGKDFRSRTGGLLYEKDEKGQISEMKLADEDSFRAIAKYLRVLARCSPEDKLLLTVGLKELGEVVAVIGDGSNDAAALKHSNLGIAMMSGTQLAKQSSDIILLDDNFYNVLNSIKWGRNVYSCTRKFLQFQLTLNIVALTASMLGGIIVRTSPITAVQMLWVNLIQDSLAALALATEPPTDDLLKTLPYGRHENIISRDMAINILSQSLYQVSVLMIVLFVGPAAFGVDPGWEDDDWSQDNGKNFTIFYQVFVLMQIFNEINCRKATLAEINIFRGFFNNWMFHLVFWSTFVVQVLIIQFGGEPMRCSRLSVSEHIICLLISSTCLLFAVSLRAIITSYRNSSAPPVVYKEYSHESDSLLNSSIT